MTATINTKFSVGQMVWHLDDEKKAVQEQITSITISVKEEGKVEYLFYYGVGSCPFEEKDLFESKEALISYIFD